MHGARPCMRNGIPEAEIRIECVRMMIQEAKYPPDKAERKTDEGIAICKYRAKRKDTREEA